MPSHRSKSDFKSEMARIADAVYADSARKRARLRLSEHRAEHPWLTGWLGEPLAPVWFIGENPSLRQAKKITAGTPEDQWAVSKGDHIFREMLVRHSYKDAPPLSKGGWHCYVTDVVKSPDYAGEWDEELTKRDRESIARAWSPVLRYELEFGRPKVIVSLGGEVDKLLDLLQSEHLVPTLPLRRKVWHYAWLTTKPDPLRRTLEQKIEAWSAQFDEVDRAAELAESHTTV